MVECNPSGAQFTLRWPVAKRPCRRSEVITLPRRHALDDWPRSSPRQASARHSSPSFCPTFCGPITALRHCRLRWGNPSRASTASADLSWAANPSGASALTRQVAPRLPAHSGQQDEHPRSPQKKLRRAGVHSAPATTQVASDGHTRAKTAGDSRAGPRHHGEPVQSDVVAKHWRRPGSSTSVSHSYHLRQRWQYGRLASPTAPATLCIPVPAQPCFGYSGTSDNYFSNDADFRVRPDLSS